MAYEGILSCRRADLEIDDRTTALYRLRSVSPRLSDVSSSNSSDNNSRLTDMRLLDLTFDRRISGENMCCEDNSAIHATIHFHHEKAGLSTMRSKWSSLMQDLFLAGDFYYCTVTMSKNSSPHGNSSLNLRLIGRTLNGFGVGAERVTKRILPFYSKSEDFVDITPPINQLLSGSKSKTSRKKEDSIKQSNHDKKLTVSTSSRGAKMIVAISEQRKTEQYVNESNSYLNHENSCLLPNSSNTNLSCGSITKNPSQQTGCMSRQNAGSFRTRPSCRLAHQSRLKTWIGVRDDIKGMWRGSSERSSEYIDTVDDAANESSISDDESFKSCNSGLPDQYGLDDHLSKIIHLGVESITTNRIEDEQDSSVEPYASSGLNDYGGGDVSQFYVSPEDNISDQKMSSNSCCDDNIGGISSKISLSELASITNETVNQSNDKSSSLRLFDIVMKCCRPQDLLDAQAPLVHYDKITDSNISSSGISHVEYSDAIQKYSREVNHPTSMMHLETSSLSNASTDVSVLAQKLKEAASTLPSHIISELERFLVGRLESPHSVASRLYDLTLSRSSNSDESIKTRKLRKVLLRSLEKIACLSKIELAESIAIIMAAVEFLMRCMLARSDDAVETEKSKLTQFMDKLGILLVMNSQLSKEDALWLDIIDFCSKTNIPAYVVSVSNIATAICHRFAKDASWSNSILAAYLPFGEMQSAIIEASGNDIITDATKNQKSHNDKNEISAMNKRKRNFPWRDSSDQDNYDMPESNENLKHEINHPSTDSRQMKSSKISTVNDPRERCFDGMKINSLVSGTQARLRRGLTYGHRMRMGGSRQVMLPPARQDASSSSASGSSKDNKRQKLSSAILKDENCDIVGKHVMTRQWTYPSDAHTNFEPFFRNKRILEGNPNDALRSSTRNFVQETPQGKGVGQDAARDDARRNALAGKSNAGCDQILLIKPTSCHSSNPRSRSDKQNEMMNSPFLCSRTISTGIAMSGQPRDDRRTSNVSFINSDIFL